MACYQQLIKLVISLTLTRNQLDGGFMQHCGGGDVKFRESKDLFWANICTRASTSIVHWMNDVTMVDDTAPDYIPWTSNEKCKLWCYSIRMVESRNYHRDHFTCTFCTECLTWELQHFPRKDTKCCEPTKSDTKLFSKPSLYWAMALSLSLSMRITSNYDRECACGFAQEQIPNCEPGHLWWLLECRIIVRVHLNPLSLSLPALLQFLHITVSCHCK